MHHDDESVTWGHMGALEYDEMVEVVQFGKRVRWGPYMNIRVSHATSIHMNVCHNLLTTNCLLFNSVLPLFQLH